MKVPDTTTTVPTRKMVKRTALRVREQPPERPARHRWLVVAVGCAIAAGFIAASYWLIENAP